MVEEENEQEEKTATACLFMSFYFGKIYQSVAPHKTKYKITKTKNQKKYTYNINFSLFSNEYECWMKRRGRLFMWYVGLLKKDKKIWNVCVCFFLSSFTSFVKTFRESHWYLKNNSQRFSQYFGAIAKNMRGNLIRTCALI